MPETLRTRRRLETAAAIRDAAVDLVLAKGLDDVTTEMIAERAGISPRSFFNYFSFKEEALMPPPVTFAEEDVARFLAGTGPVLSDMADLLMTRFGAMKQDRWRMKRIYELAHDHPKLMLVRNRIFHQHEERLAALIARRLGVEASAEKPALLAAVVSATIRVAMTRWVQANNTTPAQELRKAFAQLSRLNDHDFDDERKSERAP